MNELYENNEKKNKKNVKIREEKNILKNKKNIK